MRSEDVICGRGLSETPANIEIGEEEYELILAATADGVSAYDNSGWAAGQAVRAVPLMILNALTAMDQHYKSEAGGVDVEISQAVATLNLLGGLRYNAVEHKRFSEGLEKALDTYRTDLLHAYVNNINHFVKSSNYGYLAHGIGNETEYALRRAFIDIVKEHLLDPLGEREAQLKGLSSLGLLDDILQKSIRELDAKLSKPLESRLDEHVSQTTLSFSALFRSTDKKGGNFLVSGNIGNGGVYVITPANADSRLKRNFPYADHPLMQVDRKGGLSDYKALWDYGCDKAGWQLFDPSGNSSYPSIRQLGIHDQIISQEPARSRLGAGGYANMDLALVELSPEDTVLLATDGYRASRNEFTRRALNNKSDLFQSIKEGDGLYEGGDDASIVAIQLK